ncbi:MAG: TerC family protein [Betaproteobacteria bacterium]|nr:TerC family protein [Betaproteobacteria bacterium]
MNTDIANPWMWGGFALFVVVALSADIFMLEREGAHRVSAGEAVRWSLFWVALALVFNAGLWFWLDASAGREIANVKATEFFTGYLIEKSLSVDNIFVFLLIFNSFGVPQILQKEAIIIGIVVAIVLRAIMILIGAWLIGEFHWILYLFGAFLLFTGLKMLAVPEHDPDIEGNAALRWMRGHLRISGEFHGERLCFLQEGRRWFTPLFVVVIIIGITDVLFAVDSIPAIFAITTDPFIVMTSNIFAVLGLRALYFLIADMAARFHLLKYGLAIVLIFIGVKMLIVDWFKIPVFFSLGVVTLVLAASVALSWLSAKSHDQGEHNT